MLTERYNYQPLERVSIEGSRHYQTPNGEPLPSVTTVLDALKDKTSLYEWRKRVGDEEANRITKLATGIGTQVHLHIEKYILEEDRPGGTNLIHQMSKELSDIVIEKGLSNVDEVWGTEVPLYYPDYMQGRQIVSEYGKVSLLSSTLRLLVNQRNVNGLMITFYKVPLIQPHIMNYMEQILKLL